MLLALDTSTNYASIALVRERRLLAELNWDSGRHHSTDLFQRLQWLLVSHNITTHDLTAIAVATGPGSFNGLRVAVTAAKSLSFALELPLYACPTLDIIAWDLARSAGAAGTIWALLEAGRGQIYAAEYAGAVPGTIWGPVDGYHVLTPGELVGRIAVDSEQPVLFGGEWLPSTHATLAETMGRRALFADPLPSRRASWLAELALEHADCGQQSDVMSLEPLYLRRPAMTRSAKFALPSQVSDSDNVGDNESALGKRGGIACATSSNG